MSSRTVTGTIKYVDGTGWSGAIVTFTAVDNLIVDNIVYPSKAVTVTTDTDGYFSTDLIVPNSGTACYEVTTPNIRQRFYLAAGSAVDLSTLLAVTAASEQQDALQTLMDTHTASYLHNPVNVKAYGAIGDGRDDSDAIEAAIAAAVTLGKSEVYFPSALHAGVYGVSRTIECVTGVNLVLDHGAIISALDDIDVIHLAPQGGVINGTIITSNIDNYSHTQMVVDADLHFGLTTIVSGVIFYGSGTGTALKIVCNQKADSYSFAHAVDLHDFSMYGFDKGIHLQTNEESGSTQHATVNANFFTNGYITNCKTAIWLDYTGNNIWMEVNGNTFSNIQIQSTAGDTQAIYCEGSWNQFSNIMIWDAGNYGANPVIKLTSRSSYNNVLTNMAVSYYSDAGTLNTNWDSKQNALGFTPVNKAGDTMSGNLGLPENKYIGYPGVPGASYMPTEGSGYNSIVNTLYSLYVNLDSGAVGTNQGFEIDKGKTGVGGGTRLFRFGTDGNVAVYLENSFFGYPGSTAQGFSPFTSSYNFLYNSLFNHVWNIDSGNSSTAQKFVWGHNTTSETTTELMSLTEAGTLAVSGAIQPATLADSAAPNNSIYYSSDAGKLAYKDSGGSVHNLY